MYTVHIRGILSRFFSLILSSLLTLGDWVCACGSLCVSMCVSVCVYVCMSVLKREIPSYLKGMPYFFCRGNMNSQSVATARSAQRLP